MTSLERMIVKVCQTISRHREAATVEEQLQPAIDPLGNYVFYSLIHKISSFSS